MTTLRAFHGDPKIKAKYLKRVRTHIKLDELRKGATGYGGKGCAVWCTLDAYDHSRYPVELGVPVWLARVEDVLFEGMSLKKSKTWPLELLKAIKPGVDLDPVLGKFLIVICRRALLQF